MSNSLKLSLASSTSCTDSSCWSSTCSPTSTSDFGLTPLAIVNTFKMVVGNIHTLIDVGVWTWHESDSLMLVVLSDGASVMFESIFPCGVD
jgi:hypothetical protein